MISNIKNWSWYVLKTSYSEESCGHCEDFSYIAANNDEQDHEAVVQATLLSSASHILTKTVIDFELLRGHQPRIWCFRVLSRSAGPTSYLIASITHPACGTPLSCSQNVRIVEIIAQFFYHHPIVIVKWREDSSNGWCIARRRQRYSPLLLFCGSIPDVQPFWLTFKMGAAFPVKGCRYNPTPCGSSKHENGLLCSWMQRPSKSLGLVL